MNAVDAGHKVVSNKEWLEARKAHLAKEKAFTHQRDALLRERRDRSGCKALLLRGGSLSTRACCELHGDGRGPLVCALVRWAAWRKDGRVGGAECGDGADAEVSSRLAWWLIFRLPGWGFRCRRLRGCG